MAQSLSQNLIKILIIFLSAISAISANAQDSNTAEIDSLLNKSANKINTPFPNYVNFKSHLDSLFYKGISLHNVGRYDEAIPFFKNVITDSTYMNNRHQMREYAKMWVGNCYLKLNQSDSIKGGGIIYFSEPLDPRRMEYIDSLALLGLNIYEYDLDKCIEIFELRQKLLNEKISNKHPWVNNGRIVLMRLYKERLLLPYSYRKSLDYLDESNSIIVAKKFAQLAEEYYITCKDNYIITPIVDDWGCYYDELIQLLSHTSTTPYLNQISEISVKLIKEINNLTQLCPNLIEHNIFHYYKLGYVHYNLGKYLNDNPNPQIKSNGIDYVKKAISFYNKFKQIVLEQGELNKHQLEIYDGLLDCYNYLCYNPEPESNIIEQNLPQFNYYNLDESIDSIDNKYQERVNHSLTLELISNVITSPKYSCINDCYLNDLSTNEKEYVRLWLDKSQYLKAKDINEYMDFCSYIDCYKRFHLHKEKLQFHNNLLNYSIKNAFKLKYRYYFQFYHLSECAITCYELARPLLDPLSRGCKHTCDEKEMKQFIQQFFSYTQAFKQLYTSITAEMPNLEFIERNRIKVLYENLLIDEAGLLYEIAQHTGDISMFVLAKDAISNVMNFENYDDYWYEYSKILSKCKVIIGNSEGLNELNDQQTSRYNEIITTFKYASAENRRIIWSQFLPKLEENIKIALLLPDSKNAGELAFNSLLYKKSILLSSDNNFLNAIKRCNNDDLEFEKARIDYLSLINDSVSNLDAISKLEIRLLPYVKDINYNKSLKINWKDVHSTISQKQAAIEFGIIDTFAGPKKLFASIIKHEYDFPVLVILNEYDCTVNPLDTSFIASIHDKLKPYLTNINCIFFSPDGIIHQLPIEHFCRNNIKWIRLSSTRELIHRNTPAAKSKNISLFGGIDYNAKEPSEATNSLSFNTSSSREIPLPESLRGGASNLPYTLEEVEQISYLAHKFKFSPSLYTSKSGSENNLELLLSKKKPYYFHIATHGFYYTQKEISRVQNIKIESLGQSYSVKSENETLLRCGLLFAGANLTLSSNLYSNKPNDGILTGIEVSQLDFSNVNLISLSACQTGLGDISTDGVFGLQRGFKKAGANSLLMSLWKVDDRATQMLMTKFYEHLLSGKSKLESLSLAQKYLREYEEYDEVHNDANLTASQKRDEHRYGSEQTTENSERAKIKPFDDPKFWAAFILLDALD